jgi:hypothetical protein
MILEPVGLPDEMRSHGSVLDLKHSFIKQAQDDDYYGGSGSVGED